MKKGFKYFCIIMVGIMLLGVLVSVGTIKLPTFNENTDDTDEPSAPSVIYYPIYTDLTYVKLVSYEALKVSDKSDTVCLTFAADEGYILPDDISVTGCDYMWDSKDGILLLCNADDNVNINIEGIEGEASDEDPVEPMYYAITVNSSYTYANASNATQISDQGGVVTLKFTAHSGYKLPSSVSVSGCSYLWNASAGTLSLSNPTDAVEITINSVEKYYDVNENLTGVYGNNLVAIPGSLFGSNVEFTYTAQSGYSLPDKITVTGCDYKWVSSTGKLTLYNFRGDVTITIAGVKAPTYIIKAGHWGLDGLGTQEETDAFVSTTLLSSGVSLPCRIDFEFGSLISCDIDRTDDYTSYDCNGLGFDSEGRLCFYVMPDSDEIVLHPFEDDEDWDSVYIIFDEEKFPNGLEVDENFYKAFTSVFYYYE